MAIGHQDTGARVTTTPFYGVTGPRLGEAVA